MSQPNEQLDPALQEQIVAYLDGELDAEKSRRIEELLVSDPRVRGALQQLDRTWELLDALDTAPVREKFAQTTLEMVAVAAAKDAQDIRRQSPRRRWLLWIAALAAAALAGFLTLAEILPDPNRQLLQDLTLLENLDQYRQIESLKFLHSLSDEKLFADYGEPANDDERESLIERRQRVVAMSPAQKDQLLHRQQQFQGLEPAEQQRVRQLHQQIEHDPDGAKLRELMGRYCQWLAELPQYRRDKLADLPPTERIREIKNIRQEQAASTAWQPSDEDRRGLWRWMDHYADQHQARFLAMLPNARRQQLAKLNPQVRHRLVLALVCQRWQSVSSSSLAPLANRDLAELRSELSPETRSRLEAKPVAEQWQILAEWIHQAAKQRLAFRQGDRGLLPNFDEQLAQFFEHQLSDEDRDRLLSLPGDEMQMRLRQMYLMQMKPGEPVHRPPHKPPPKPPASAGGY